MFTLRNILLLCVVCALLLSVAGCATDWKLTGPSLSVRTGAGKEPANLIAGQPPNEHVSNISSGSAAELDPADD